MIRYKFTMICCVDCFAFYGQLKYYKQKHKNQHKKQEHLFLVKLML